MCCRTGRGTGEHWTSIPRAELQATVVNSQLSCVLTGESGNTDSLAVSGKRILENSPRWICWALLSAVKGSALPALGLGDMERP